LTGAPEGMEETEGPMAASNPATALQLTRSATQAATRARVFWSGLNPRQRLYLGTGAGIVLLVLGIFVKLIAGPNYKPLMTGLQPEDAQAIAAELAAKKIPYVVSPDSTTVSVPAAQLDSARLEVAAHDTTHSGRIGFEIFDKTSWGQTEFDEKVDYQRALEGELERTIETLNDVKSARVHLVMPTDSVFSEQQRGAKASVTLRLKEGSLSRAEAMQIARLVAGAVDDLDPKDVVVTDADSSFSMQSGGAADGNDTPDQELMQRLIATLAPVVGADAVHAAVNVEYETGSSEETDEKYDPNVSVVLNMQRSEESSTGNALAGGVPGTSSNVPGAKAKVAAPARKNDGPYSASESATYGVNKSTRHTIEPAGGIRRVSAAIVVDDARQRTMQNGRWVTRWQKRSPQELQMIQSLAQAAIGFNSTRGDVISVENLSFDHPQEADDATPSFADRARKQLDSYSSVLRYAVLLCLFVLVYLLMVRPLQKRVLAAPLPGQLPAPPVPAQMESENLQSLSAVANLAQRSVALKKELAAYIRSEPESSTGAVRAWLREDAS
jgi:flagellar M-ring protein FliF